MEIYGVIYQIFCVANGKIYLGQARDVDKRWKEHLYELKNNRHHNEYLQRAWRKYSSSAFEWTIKCDCFSQNDMNALEIFYIKQAGENCFNATLGGEGCEATEKTRKKISNAHRGKTISEEQRNNHSLAMSGVNNPNYGKPLSEEHKRKLGDAKRGQTLSAESIAKRTATRAANDGYRRSAEATAKAKATRAANGKPVSEETRKKMSDARRGKFSGPNSPHYGKPKSVESIAKRNATRAANKLRKAQALEAQ